jgi:hypothetical protein
MTEKIPEKTAKRSSVLGDNLSANLPISLLLKFKKKQLNKFSKFLENSKVEP